MGTIKLTVPDRVEKKFREKAMEKFGHRKGSLSEAGEQALKKWSSDDEKCLDEVEENPVEKISGMLSHIDDKTALELEEEAHRQRAESALD